MKVIIIIKEDIKLFPPVITLIQTIGRMGHKVIVVGHYSDLEQKEKYENEGVLFIETGFYDVNSSLLNKLKGNLLFRKRVKEILKKLNLNSDEDYCLWIMQGLTISLLHNIISEHPTVLHPLEFVDKDVKLFYRLLSPGYNAAKTYAKAKKVVNCEYNRAQILKGILNLEELPEVLPNKMRYDESLFNNIPPEIQERVDCLKKRLEGKKVILYQGIFVKRERRLEEFCKAVKLLGKEYVLVIMGADNQEGYKELQHKFPNTQIVFIPFIKPPYHLLVTQMAHIGILTYFPRPDTFASVINPLYCAPNKIFEYGKFGIPMIGNDIPGLHYIFKEFNCGRTVSYPMTETKIKDAIESIFSDYEKYSIGAKDYFNSVDIPAIIKNILK